MKYLTTILSTTIVLSTTGQNCIHQLYVPQLPGWSQGWNGAKLDAAGGVLYAEWTQAMSIGRVGPDAQPDWMRRIVHMSPSNWLSPEGVMERSDGGSLVNGYFSPAWQYDAPCLVSMAQDGQFDWSRIYMADSTYQNLGAYVHDVQELPNGDLLVTADCIKAVGLARLDASGLPIWYNRFSVTTMDALHQMGAMTVIQEPGDEMTVLGQWYSAAKTTIMRINGDGSGLWAFTYEFPGVFPKAMIRAADNTYYAAGRYQTTYGGCVIHFNADGTLDWIKSYPAELTSIAQLPSGDLLVATQQNGSGLLALGTDGTPTSAWTSLTVSNVRSEIIGVRSDSVYVLSNYDDGTSGLTIATSINDLSCEFNTATPPSATTLGAPVSISDTLIVTPDELKTWTMNIAPSPGMDEVDVQAFGASAPARPGFTHMIYCNTPNMGGATTGPLTRTLTVDPLLTLVDIYPTPSDVSGNVITWTGPDSLGGFDYTFAYVEAAVPADPGLIGTTVTHTYSVVQDSTETDLTNNTITFTREITGSFDPNDKQVLPRDFYHIMNDSVLDYTIQFQNTGNDTAFTVVVRDTLPLDVDTRTFEMGAASHPYTYTLTGNGILTFTFNNILLPDSNTNEPMSHGLVNFRIKPMLPLALGQEISNTADIYFDFNPPIHTPAATVVVTDETGVRPLVKPAQLVVYPVPAKNTLSAMLPEGFKPTQAFAIGADGRRLPLVLPPSSAGQIQFATQHLPAGAYVLTLRSQDGKRLSARFVKE